MIANGYGGIFGKLEELLLRTDIAATQLPILKATQRADVKDDENSVSVSAVDVKLSDGRKSADATSAQQSLLVTGENFDEANTRHCKQLVEQIFSSPDVQNSFDGSLKEALSLLSKMNSRDVHFVLEVIQNAADSTFPEGVLPTLLIQLESKKVVVKTNEIGFTKENVKAITAVGKSHKKNVVGFIGHKGIG